MSGSDMVASAETLERAAVSIRRIRTIGILAMEHRRSRERLLSSRLGERFENRLLSSHLGESLERATESRRLSSPRSLSLSLSRR